MPAARVWVLSDGAAGNRLQALALAEALELGPVREHQVRPRGIWAWLAPQFAPVLRLPDFAPADFGPPWPDVLVGAGRFGAAAVLAVRRASGGCSRAVQILDPRVDPARFDLVIAPAHDGLQGSTVLPITGSLHRIDAPWLARERLAHAPLSSLALPRCVVLIGGPHRGVGFGKRAWQQLADTLAVWRQRDGASALLIASRRTPHAWGQRLRALAQPGDRLWLGPEDGDNPYRGALAWGERFVVSADSVNMQCEALATGREVYSLCDGVPRGKLGRFHRELVESGRLRPLRSDARPWTYTPLRELQRILPEVRARLGLTAPPR